MRKWWWQPWWLLFSRKWWLLLLSNEKVEHTMPSPLYDCTTIPTSPKVPTPMHHYFLPPFLCSIPRHGMHRQIYKAYFFSSVSHYDSYIIRSRHDCFSYDAILEGTKLTLNSFHQTILAALIHLSTNYHNWYCCEVMAASDNASYTSHYISFYMFTESTSSTAKKKYTIRLPHDIS